MKVVNKPLKELVMYSNNPRNNKQAVDEVAESIKQFGFKVPMVIDTKNVIVCGHTRYLACLKLGIKDVPCVIADDLTEDQIKAFRLVENKTSELAEWDEKKLNDEIFSIESDLEKFDFKKLNKWFDEREKWDNSRQEGNEEYNDFLDKFEEPKTTDDCYTPDNIYEVVANYVSSKYKIKRNKFIRPFYPNGDYQKENYQKGSVVVDNPPFSILAEIIDFYLKHDIKFFLFCQCMLCFNYISRPGVCVYPLGINIVYENGALVPTGFLTNISTDNTIVDNSPELRKMLDEENKKNLEAQRKSLPKYEYPYDVLTAAKAGYLSQYGESIKLKKDECLLIRQLDSQKETGGAIYGTGLLLSERAAAERAAAERAAAERAAAKVFQLSEREKELQKGLK